MSWLLHDVLWAWRGIVGRRARAGLVVGLLAVTIAANTAVFAVADALVFHPFPYPYPERIVTLKTLPDGTSLTKAQAAARVVEWRKQTDIFSAVGGYLQKNVFVTGSGTTEQVRTADVTVGFLDVLGVKPRWGRPFVDGDESQSEFAVLISEKLARKYFGDPARAPGQLLDATAGPHRVVGVMAGDFAYPSASYEMWRALDPVGPLTRNFGGIPAMARIAPGVPDGQLQRLLEQRAPAVGAAIGLPSYAVTAASAMPSSGTRSPRQTLVLVLLGAALCLLLATCANVASLELAAAIGRARTYAIQLALGASRASLTRVAALEGMMLIGAALVCGVLLVWLSSALLLALLPDWLRLGGQHRIGLDARAIGYSTLVAAVAWLAAAMPPVIAASRPSLVALLRLEDRTAAVSRAGVRLRHLLTAAEVAVAVTLVIGGLLYTRSYRQLLAVDKGFDSSGLAAVRWTVPSGHFRSSAERAEAVKQMTSGLAALPGIEAMTESSAPPSTGDSPSQVALEIDGRPPLDTPVLIGTKWVDASYFPVVRLPLRSGRVFAAGDLASEVVVSETFAKRFWPDGDAVGHTFRLRPQQPWNRVIGVVGDFRSERKSMPALSDRQVFFYALWQPPPPPAQPANPTAPPANVIDTGGSYGFIALTLRMDSPARATALLAMARSFDPRLRVTLDLVDDMYADQNADTRLASRIVGGFSALAFVVAIAGVYGLMAYLVSSRRREIGVRIALGASAGDISRLILGSSTRLVAAGAALGAIAAVVASRWIESALFGVTATDPATYVTVVAAVMLTALAATWRPARQAAGVDPAMLLRTD